MANTSSRTLRLPSLLQTHRYWPGLELADQFAGSERTLRRDIDRLREPGYPVDANCGVAGGGYQLRSGTAMPPLLLDDEEPSPSRSACAPPPAAPSKASRRPRCAL